MSGEGDDTDAGSSATGALLLVVDDDAALRAELSSALQTAGYRTISAADAEAALAMVAEDTRIAVILTDIRMPGQSGIALAETALREPINRHAVEVILMSGHADEAEAVAGLQAGALGLLRKPFRLAEALDMVDQAMARAVARRGAAGSV